jgi:hypothetical protein
MAILSTRKPRVRRPHVRSIRLVVGFNGEGKNAVLRITQDGQVAEYFLDQLAADFGRGFLLEKIGPDESRDNEVYHVNLNGTESSCTCPGHSYGGFCKHLDGLTALVAAGKL